MTHVNYECILTTSAKAVERDFASQSQVANVLIIQYTSELQKYDPRRILETQLSRFQNV